MPAASRAAQLAAYLPRQDSKGLIVHKPDPKPVSDAGRADC